MAEKAREMTRTRDLSNPRDVVITFKISELYAEKASLGTNPMLGSSVVDEANGDTIPFLCPLHREADGHYKVWADGETIDGFAAGVTDMSLHESQKVVLSETLQVRGLVAKEGVIPYDQIPLPAGSTQNALLTAVKTSVGNHRFKITNLTGAY